MSAIEAMPRKKNSSLTKHGAHKISYLLKEFGSVGVLDNLWGSLPNVKIDYAQARKNLSAYKGVVPVFWDDAVKAGDRALNGLVLMAIILSHGKLVQAMKAGSKGRFKGVISRGEVVNKKDFSNLKHIFEELGFATNSSVGHIAYDLEDIFTTPELPPLARALIFTKVAFARDGSDFDIKKAVAEENLDQVFSVKLDMLIGWLFPEEELMEVDEHVAGEIGFFITGGEGEGDFVFDFKPGHTQRRTGAILVKRSELVGKAGLRHNYIQNKLYDDLVERFGKDCVGTEQNASGGKFIDLVVKNGDLFWLYEIKTASTARLCIRQALPQLLEYAYWKNTNAAVDKLIIIAEALPTEDSEEFLKKMREDHNIPIHYEKFTDVT